MARPAPACRSRCTLSIAVVLAVSCPSLSAQRVVLPHGTGGVVPSADWTVLRTADLERAERATDPAAEPARTLLRARLAELQRDARTGEHVLFHQPGPTPGSLRLVDAFADAVSADVDELRAAGRAKGVADVLAPHLREAGFAVRALGGGDPGLFAPGSLAVRFELDKDGATFAFVHHVVPAGDFTQYFETWHVAGDDTAPAAIQALLQTFDGARQSGDVLGGMLLGGLAGAIAGVLTALLRRRRRACAPSSGRR